MQFLAVSHVWHQSDVSCALDGNGETSLMASAIAADSSRKNFAALGDELFELVGIFVVDVINFVGAETACFAASGWRVMGHSTNHNLLSPCQI